jgi:hypothetical protein
MLALCDSGGLEGRVRPGLRAKRAKLGFRSDKPVARHAQPAVRAERVIAVSSRAFASIHLSVFALSNPAVSMSHSQRYTATERSTNKRHPEMFLSR